MGICSKLAAHDKPRVIVLTDIENETDDAQSIDYGTPRLTRYQRVIVTVQP